MEGHYIEGTIGDWREYDAEEVKRLIRKEAGNPDLKHIGSWADEAADIFEEKKSEICSVLTTTLMSSDDAFLRQLHEEVRDTKIPSYHDLIEAKKPSRQFMTRDAMALGQGMSAPPHIIVYYEAAALRQPFEACDRLAKKSRQAGSHLTRKRKAAARDQLVGTNVFIGHGGSKADRRTGASYATLFAIVFTSPGMNSIVFQWLALQILPDCQKCSTRRR